MSNELATVQTDLSIPGQKAGGNMRAGQKLLKISLVHALANKDVVVEWMVRANHKLVGVHFKKLFQAAKGLLELAANDMHRGQLLQCLPNLTHGQRASIFENNLGCAQQGTLRNTLLGHQIYVEDLVPQH